MHALIRSKYAYCEFLVIANVNTLANSVLAACHCGYNASLVSYVINDAMRFNISI